MVIAALTVSIAIPRVATATVFAMPAKGCPKFNCFIPAFLQLSLIKGAMMPFWALRTAATLKAAAANYGCVAVKRGWSSSLPGGGSFLQVATVAICC